MGQVFSTGEELSHVKETIGSLLYDAMLEGGAVPDLGVVHPLLLTNRNEGPDSRDRLQDQLQQVHTTATHLKIEAYTDENAALAELDRLLNRCLSSV